MGFGEDCDFLFRKLRNLELNESSEPASDSVSFPRRRIRQMFGLRGVS
jgi:hypothetical protein